MLCFSLGVNHKTRRGTPLFWRLAWLGSTVLTLVLLGLACSQGDCRFDSDCPDDKICKAGVCTTNLLDKPCSAASDCGADETCLAASCVKVECEEGAQRQCFEGPGGTMNVGICRGGTQTCQSRRWSACVGQILPVQEVCNQLDDDCNGQVDDDSKCQADCQDGQTRPCYTGPTGTQDIGVCRKGTESCVSGAWSGQCDGQTTPTSKEVCDDKQDNNCNGQVDEGCGPCSAGDTRSCYTGPPNTKSIGECKDGNQTCQNGQWSLCINEVKPSAEQCDNKDNDCNGQVDDNPQCQSACQDGKTRTCYNGPAGTQGVGICKAGVEQCQGGQWSGQCVGAVTPGSEKCDDKLDNNCNGQTDENCGACRSGDQEVCFSGSAGCSKQPDGSYRCNTPCRAGIRTCQNGQWGNCTGEVTPKSSETCNNNIDDDCNGQVDDGCGCQNGQTQQCYNGPSGTSGVGVCKSGLQTCQNGTWGSCVGEIQPTSSELCNDGKDNNCNGQTDENCQSAGNLHKSCQSNTDCGTGLVCIGFQGQASGTCFQDCSSSAGVCSSNGDGRTKCLAFAQDQQGNTISVCIKEAASGTSCDVTKSVVCVSGNVCAGGVCKPSQTATEGQECNPSASTPVLCGSNLTCVTFGTGFPSICLKNCTAGSPTSCGSGFTCISLSGGGGACLQTGCTSNANCSYAYHSCIQDSNLGTKACYPDPIPGPLTFGKKCNPSVPAERCQRGLTCLGLQNATNGFCTVDCTSSVACPSSPSGSTCVQINATQSACLFPCTSCPTGLQCNTSVNYCFP
ncbi:MAG: hypothetical protein EP343_28780 [Deltaproteobacteria bacterium]|nr:MAG: hypothetical protein EP343_28780 [Deltaproteobacteria bacterium]